MQGYEVVAGRLEDWSGLALWDVLCVDVCRAIGLIKYGGRFYCDGGRPSVAELDSAWPKWLEMDNVWPRWFNDPIVFEKIQMSRRPVVS